MPQLLPQTAPEDAHWLSVCVCVLRGVRGSQRIFRLKWIDMVLSWLWNLEWSWVLREGLAELPGLRLQR